MENKTKTARNTSYTIIKSFTRQSRGWLKVRCNTCRSVWNTRTDTFKGGHRCAKCAGNAPLTKDGIIAKLAKRSIKILKANGKYRARTRATFECTTCHTKWSTTIGAVLYTRKLGTGCPNCAEAKRRWNRPSAIKIQRMISALRNRGIVMLDKYTTSNQRYRFRCLVCNKITKLLFNTEYYRPSEGYGCKKCREGARTRPFGISEENTKLVIEQMTGWKFHKATSKELPWLRKLHLDGYNHKHMTAFEYQGKQHYELVNLKGQIDTKQKLQARKRRDWRKRVQCWRHGIRLIAIPYWIKDLKRYLSRRIAAITANG